jgi:hypothetical protein
MTLYAEVKEDGTLIAKAPKSLWGKKVKITVLEEKPKKPKQKKKLSQWEEISAVLEEARTLDIPRRTIDEILADLRDFRESE